MNMITFSDPVILCITASKTLEVAASKFLVIYADTITFVSITALIITLPFLVQPFLHALIVFPH